MYNILYLNDYINYYSKKINKIIKYTPYSKTVANGLIIDVKRFIKCFKKMLKDNNIKESLFTDNILIITPPNFNNAYKYLYKQIFTSLNFNIIVFKSEINYYKLGKNNVNINIYNDSFYITKTINNKTISVLYNIEDINNIIINNKYDYYLYGLYNQEVINYLEKNNLNYYMFEVNENFFIKKLKYNYK